MPAISVMLSGVLVTIALVCIAPAAAADELQTFALDLYAGTTCTSMSPHVKKTDIVARAVSRLVDRQCGVLAEDIKSVQVTCTTQMRNVMVPVGTNSIFKTVTIFMAPAGTAKSMELAINAAASTSDPCSGLGKLCNETASSIQVLGAVVPVYKPPVGGGLAKIINTFAGVGTATGGLLPTPATGVAALQAQLKNPNGVAVNSVGDVFIADAPSHTIKVVRAADGLMYVFAGVMNTKGSGVDNTAATSHLLSNPRGVAVDVNDTVWICDSGNHKIKRVPTKGTGAGLISTYAGTGALGGSGDGGLATLATLNNPRALVLDSAQNVYWSDVDGNRVRKVSKATGVITTVAGTGVAGQPTLVPGQIGNTQMVNSVRGLAINTADDSLYIADTNNNQVLKVQPDGSLVRAAGNGTSSSAPDGLSSPFGLAFDAATDTLYICDVNNQVVKAMQASVPGMLSTYAGNGTAGFAGDGKASDKAMLYNTQAIAIHQPSQRVFLADSSNYRIRVINGTYSWN